MKRHRTFVNALDERSTYANSLLGWFRCFQSGFGFVTDRELVESRWFTKEACRFWPIMFVAPITFFFEFRDQRLVAKCTLFFGYAVFNTPPAADTLVDFAVLHSAGCAVGFASSYCDNTHG